MLRITLSNQKLGGTIPQLNLPPVITCRKNAPCIKGCYARKGTFNYSNVKESLQNNLNEFSTNPKGFFKQVVDFLNNGDVIYKFFRWHSSGDIVNEDYFLGMIETAKKCKNTRFLAYTKKYEIVNEYLNKGGKIPSNLNIVFSNWGNKFQCENPHNLPITDVRFKKEELNGDIPKFAIQCVGSCKDCRTCWKLRKNQEVVFNQH